MIGTADNIHKTVWESRGLANTMTAMATTRRYAGLSIGSLGAVEMTAPRRRVHTSKGLKRFGYRQRERLYHDLHSSIDVKQ